MDINISDVGLTIEIITNILTCASIIIAAV